MPDLELTTEQLLQENEELRLQLAKLEKEITTNRKPGNSEIEARFSAVYTAMSDGMAIHEIIYNSKGKAIDYIITDVNPSFEKITGLFKNKISGRKATEVYSVIEAPYIDIYSEVALTGKSVSFETFFPPMKKYFKVSVYSPSKGKFATVFQDITERIQNEEVLAFQARILSEVYDAIFSSDKSFKITYWNKASERIFGWTKEEAIGKNSGELLKPKVENSSRDLERSKLKNDGRWEGEVQFIRKDGTYFFAEVNSQVLKDPAGRDSGTIVVARDITESKKIEVALRESEERYHQMFDQHQAIGLLIEPESGAIIDANSAALKYYGYTFDQLCSLHIQDINQLPPQEVEAERKKALKEQRNYFVFPHRLANGEMRWVEVYSSPLSGNGRQLLYSIIHDITSRKNAEESLRVSEERFSKTFKNSPSAITITRLADGKIIDGNDSAYSLLGYNHEEVIGKTTRELGIWTNSDDRLRLSNTLAAKGSIHNEDFVLRKKDGTQVPVNLSASLIMIEQEECFICSFIDLTERKKAEEALKVSEERFKLALKNAPVGIAIQDRNMVYTWAYNQRSRRPDEIVGKTDADLFAPEDLEWIVPIKNNILESGKELNVEKWITTKGRRYYLGIHYEPIFDASGEIIGIGAATIDLTDRKLAEETLAFQSRLLSDVHDSVFSSDRNYSITYWNKAAEKMFGWTKEEALGKNSGELLKPKVNGLHRHERSKSKSAGYWEGEVQYVRKDGSYFFAEVNSTDLKDKDGKDSGNIIVLRDITERKQTEETLKSSEKRYSALFANKINGMAHCRIIVNDLGQPVDYIILQINEAYERIIGIKKADIEGHRVTEVFPGFKNYAVDYIGMYGKIALEDGEIMFEELFEATGQTLSIYAYCPVPGEFIAIFTDVTKRVRADHALRESEEQYRNLFSVMPSGVAVYEVLNDGKDPDGKDFIFKDMNPAGERIDNVKRADIIGKSLFDFFPTVTDMGLTQLFQRVWKTGVPEYFPVTLYRDSRISLWITNYVYKMPSGELVAIFDDITEHKQAELALKESENKFYTVFHSAPVAMSLASVPEGKLIDVNQAWLNLVNISQKEEILGKNSMELGLIPDAESRLRILNEFGDKGYINNVEIKATKRDGQSLDLLLNVHPVEIAGSKYMLSTNSDITALKNADKALRLSEERLRVTLRSIGDAVITVDNSGKINFLNPVAVDLTGWKLSEAEGQPVTNVFRIINEITQKPAVDIVQRVLNERHVVELSNHTSLVTKKGNQIPIEDSAAPIKDPSGKVIGVVLVFHDVTEKRKAQDALKKSEERFRNLVKFAPTAIYEIDFQTRKFISVNDTMCELSGYSREELLSFDSLELLEEESRKLFLSRINELLNGEKPNENVEYKVRSKDGRILDAVLNMRFNFNENGIPVGAMVVGHDITQRKQAERELRAAGEALKESEKRFRTLAENIPDMIVRFDNDLRLLYANEAVLNRTGLTLDFLTGKTAKEYGASSASDRNWQNVAREVIKTGIPGRLVQQNLWQGSTRVYDAQIVPERDETGHVNSVISIARDVTEMKMAENILRNSEQRLKYHLENSPLAVVEWNKDFNVIQWSLEAEKMFGLAKEEVMGMRIDQLNIIYSEDIPLVEKTSARLLSGKELKVVSQNRNVTKSGEILECIWYNSVLLDDNGEMNSVMSLVEDVTFLRKTERKLIASQENYKELVTNARSMILKFDNEARFTFVNEFALEFFGYEEDELLGKSVMIVVPETDSTGRDLNEMVDEIVENPDIHAININENIKKNGEKVWVEWHNKALFDESGSKTGHIAIGIDITIRKKAEDALKESEIKLRSVLNAASESIYMFDNDGHIVMTNKTGIERLNRTQEEELVGHSYSEFMSPELAKSRQEKISSVFSSGLPMQYEDVRSSKTFYHSFYPVFKDNKVQYVVSYSTDITQRKKAEQSLIQSEERFRTIAESLTIMVVIKSESDSIISFVNEPFAKSFGFMKEDLTGKVIPDIYFNPEDDKSLHSLLKIKGIVENMEIKVKRNDGSSFWMMTSFRKIIFNSEPSYLMTSIDISETKNAQEELLRLNRTLDAQSKTSQALTHATNEEEYLNEICKIIIEDCGHSMVWIGYTEEDKQKSVIPVAYHGFDKGYIEQLQITYSDSARGNGPTGRAIKTGKPAICRNMLTDPSFLPWKEQALKRGYASSLVLPLLLNGKAFGAVSIYSKEPDPFTDKEIDLLSGLADDLAYGISFLRLSESERKSAIAVKENETKLKELVATKDKFFNIVAHDLKNPFTSLLGSSELLYDNINQMNSENVRKLALILNDSAKGGYAILQNLLDWSRSQTGLIHFNPALVNLRSIVDENIDNLQLQVMNKEIRLKSELTEDLFILADKNMVNTILRNLLSNAIKYTFKNGIITVVVLRGSKEITLTVKDSGIGISKEKAATLFQIENSLSVPGTEKEQGTGLGLKLCKEFTERMGGRIWVESKVGKGSEFKFTIPVADENNYLSS